jgi:hypothetical protein
VKEGQRKLAFFILHNLWHISCFYLPHHWLTSGEGGSMVRLISKLDLSGARRKAIVYSYLLNKRLSRRLKRYTNSHVVQVYKCTEDFDSHLIDDLALTLAKESAPGATP